MSLIKKFRKIKKIINDGMAEWLGKGLQILLPRFESGCRLQKCGSDVMLCSAIKKKYGRSGEKRGPQVCQNEATLFLTVKGETKDEPYCEHCAYWIKEICKNGRIPLSIRNINKK